MHVNANSLCHEKRRTTLTRILHRNAKPGFEKPFVIIKGWVCCVLYPPESSARTLNYCAAASMHGIPRLCVCFGR